MSKRVLVIGDTHCPAMLPEYVDFLRDIYKQWSCDTVIHIGDCTDWAAISFHEKNPACPSAGDEYTTTLRQVQTLYKAFPKAVVMTGNHDDLPARQARTAGIPVELLRDYAKVWETPGWDWLPRYSTYELDGVKYAHGDRGKGGQYAALRNAKDNFCSWVQGHVHGQAGVQYYANSGGLIFGANVGCGLDRTKACMDYGMKLNVKPVVGAGIVIDGKHAYFEPMLL